PVLTPRLSARWVRLVTDVPPGVVRPLIDGLRNPVVVRDDSIRDHVAPELTSFEESVGLALAARANAKPEPTTATVTGAATERSAADSDDEPGTERPAADGGPSDGGRSGDGASDGDPSDDSADGGDPSDADATDEREVDA
ncbi:MAG: hypothetical protein ABEI99_00540, partial [Halobaculum sp.]